MGRGHLGIRKIYKKETEYNDKKKEIKHSAQEGQENHKSLSPL